MTVTLNSRQDVNLANYRRVAVGGEGVAIGAPAVARMGEARAAFVRLLEGDRNVFIYQTTSGGGPLASITIPPEEQRQRARMRQVRPSLGDSFGEADLPERVVRGIVFARLADYVEGHAKSRPVVAQEIAALLDRPLPRVPLGGVTGSGEIVALAHVLGEIRSMTFEEGEFDSLSNGSPGSAALVADAALQAGHRARLAIAVFALSARAFGYAPDVAASRAALGDDRLAVQALEELDAWLAPAQGRAPTAPASYRVLPWLLGQALRAARRAAEVAEISLRSVKNNPAYVAPGEGEQTELVLHNGGYHDAGAGPALDALSLAWANLCALADLQTTKLHSGELSGLPDMLAPAGQDAWSTTAMLGFIPIGFSERARQAATPTTLPASEGGGYGGQDDVPLGTYLAYEKQQTAARQLEGALAVLATAAGQAFSISDRSPGAQLQPLAELVTERVTFGDPEHPRPRGEQMAGVAEAFAAMVLDGRAPRPAGVTPGEPASARPVRGQRALEALARAAFGADPEPDPSDARSGANRSPHARPLPVFVPRAIAHLTGTDQAPATEPALGTSADAAAALGGVVTILDRRRLELVELVLALSIETYRAPLDAYHPALAELWGDPFQAAALRRLDGLLAPGDRARQRHQGPVSYRIVPRLTGQARRALHQLEEVATAALGGPASDPDLGADPTVVAAAPLAHDVPVAAAIDAMSAVWADIGALAHRHVVRLARARPGTGAPPVPAPTPAVDEMRRLAQPAVLGALELSADACQDVAPLAPSAYLSHRRVAARLDEVLAVLAAACAASPAADEARLSPSLAGLCAAARRYAPACPEGWPATAPAGLADAMSDFIEHGRGLGT